MTVDHTPERLSAEEPIDLARLREVAERPRSEAQWAATFDRPTVLVLLAHLADVEARLAAAWDEGVDAAFRGAITRQNADDVKRRNPRRVAADPRTHGLNHAPLPDGVLLDQGFCHGCDDERAALHPDPSPGLRWCEVCQAYGDHKTTRHPDPTRGGPR